MNNIYFALLITLLAGLSTGIGGLIAIFSKKDNKNFLSISLGFSAGVMIYVSFIEIFQKAKVSLIAALGETKGNWITVLAFFGGMLLIALIDKAIPSQDNPHEICALDDLECQKELENKTLKRTGILTALAIGIHNFPEGLATFISAMQDSSVAIPIAIAIALHNIPEGIAVAVPMYHSTGSKKKAFLYSLASGISEPIGAIVGFLLLRNFFNDLTFGIIFASVAGIMVFISLDELLPAAREYGEHHLSIYGLISGMMVMALSLLLLQ
ncbi:MAG: zinc transporter ZupT [Clostridium sp.]|uniref:zinc transporter ZupT n=1 Tax=Clostridium sp. TaxID=1506 RepID=UPI003066283C